MRAMYGAMHGLECGRWSVVKKTCGDVWVPIEVLDDHAVVRYARPSGER